MYSKFDNNLPALVLVKVPDVPKPSKPDFERGNWQILYDKPILDVNVSVPLAQQQAELVPDEDEIELARQMHVDPKPAAAPQWQPRPGEMVMCYSIPIDDYVPRQFKAFGEGHPVFIYTLNSPFPEDEEIESASVAWDKWRIPTAAEYYIHSRYCRPLKAEHSPDGGWMPGAGDTVIVWSDKNGFNRPEGYERKFLRMEGTKYVCAIRPPTWGGPTEFAWDHCRPF